MKSESDSARRHGLVLLSLGFRAEQTMLSIRGSTLRRDPHDFG